MRTEPLALRRILPILLCVICVSFLESSAVAYDFNGQALYVPPPNNAFITDPNEQQVVLNVSSGSISDAQATLDAARSSNPDAVIVLNLTGTYTVSDTPLTFPSKTALVLTGTIQAAPGTTATTLIFINGQSKVSISGGLLDGAGADVNGIQVASSGKVNIDLVTIRNTGREGILFSGLGNTVWGSGSTITRCEITGSAAAGIKIQQATQVLALDSNIHDNAGAGVDTAAVHGAIVHNTLARNGVGVSIQGSDTALTDNTFDANGTGLRLTSASANNSCLDNIISNSTTVAIDLNGSNNLVYANALTGNASDLASAGTTNFVIPDAAPLSAPGNGYFYPPTVGNPHSDAIIMNGMGRTDLTVNGTTLADVQSQYNSARAANPGNVMVLHMNGTFTHNAAPLTLASNTAVLLNGTINVTSTASGPVINGSSLQFVSISGGTIECNSRVMEGINLAGSTIYLDHVTVQHCGVQATRSTSNSIHLHNGSKYNIIRDSRVDVSGGRCIWTQNSSIRYIVVGNHTSHCQQDGIDFDSHTANSLAKGNLSENLTRYGIFIEEGDQFVKAYGNTMTHTGRGLNFFANATGPTRRNMGFCNQIIANSNGVRTGAINGNTTDENFVFNNTIQGTTGNGIQVDAIGTNNYFSNNILSGNKKDLSIDPTGGADFFNNPSLTDATPPVLNLPGDHTFEATGPDGAVASFAVSAQDAVSGSVPVTVNPPSGSLFPLGATTVTASARDAAGNTATGTFTITVVDTTPPALALPDNLTLEATGPDGAIATYAASAHDLVSGDVPVTLSIASGSTFPLGTTTVSVSATDAAGNTATGTFTVAVVDTTPPTLSLPANITVEATGPDGAAAAYSATAHDVISGDVAVTFSTPSGSTFPLGTTTVTGSATDAAGNTATGSFTVTVVDTTPPTLSLPGNLTLEATGPDGAVATYTATAHDVVSGDVAVTFTISSGSIFPLGTTTVTGSATDAAGNTATASFTVTVVDTSAPTLSLPGNLMLEATGPDGAVANFTVTAHDIVSGDVAVKISIPSGSTFPLGSTTVTATASDAAGNMATGSFIVTVRDTTPPSLTLPGNLVVEATGPSGAMATFTASAQDVVSGNVRVVLNPASGSTFPLGTTTITATATDAAGNIATGSFTVTVRDTTTPAIIAVAAFPEVLWPPNHRMVPVAAVGLAIDAVDVLVPTRIVSVTSNEPVDGTGDGDTAPDWEITGPATVNLRAERSGTGNGRIYIITLEARDRSGNASMRTVNVIVPKHR